MKTQIVTLTLMFLITGAHASAQDTEKQITIAVRPAQSVEERVAEEVKAKELRNAAENKLAAEKSARIAQVNPRDMLASARVVFIFSDTSYFDALQLQNELRKKKEFESWQMAIVDGWDNRNSAEVVVEVDRPLFTFTFTYKVLARNNGIVLATGKVTAFDGNAAAPRIADKIVEDIKIARGESPKKR